MEDEDIYDFYDEEKLCSLSGSDDLEDPDQPESKKNHYFCTECKRFSNDSRMLCSPVSA